MCFKLDIFVPAYEQIDTCANTGIATDFGGRVHMMAQVVAIAGMRADKRS